MTPSRKKQDLIRLARQAGIFTSIPMILVGGPTIGFLIGRFLDRRLSSDPWCVAIAVFIGLIASVVETVHLIQVAQQSNGSSDNESS